MLDIIIKQTEEKVSQIIKENADLLDEQSALNLELTADEIRMYISEAIQEVRKYKKY
ncbi:MAG: hypothetical protein WAM26_16520 [Nitrososphaeraceae archaeon]